MIERALADLNGDGPKYKEVETDRAMAFILSDKCRAYCLYLNMDYEQIREKAAAFYQERRYEYVPCPGRFHGLQFPSLRFPKLRRITC
jgi:hypothetical protein